MNAKTTVRLSIMVLGFLLLGNRCKPLEQFCTDINMTLTMGAPGQLIPDCFNDGSPLKFQNGAVVTFPGLSPEITTAQVPQGSQYFAIQLTPTASAKAGKPIPVLLHDVSDPNSPKVTQDYTIHVTFFSPWVALQVTDPPGASVPVGESYAFKAIATDPAGSSQDVTSTATWTSLSPQYASVNSQGLAKGLIAGTTAIITASFQGLTAQATLNVTSAALLSVSVNPPTATVDALESTSFTATGSFSDGTTADLTKTVVWSSSDTTIATISNEPGSQGKARGVAGSPTAVTITAKDNDISGTALLTVQALPPPRVLVSVAVAPPSTTMMVGQSTSFTASGNFSDGTASDLTTTAVWSSSDTTIATVSNAPGSPGLATGVGASATSVTISATDPVTHIKGTAQLSVMPAPPSVAVTATPSSTGSNLTTNLNCTPSGTGPFTFAWHAYQDDGTPGGAGVLTFSDPTVASPTATVSAPPDTNFYVFCVVTDTSTSLSGSGYAVVSESDGALANVTVSPSTIHAGLTAVTFDGTASVDAGTNATSWVVQYGGNVTPSGIEGYLTIPTANWTIAYSDFSPTGLVENVPASALATPGAYRVQLTVTSPTDSSQQTANYYFQVVP